ncbi:MAG TPA: MerR family transcriptional regulator [Frankiaceae bacterium]|nr:MerR family transcriptional regulator [Frankiaceae bacterium]
MSTSGASSEPAAEESFPIEELAHRTGMTVRTLRAYQSRKLLPAPEVRARMGYYSDRHVARVELVKDLQAEGFKLDTIARMLDNTGESDVEILQFSRTVKSLFGESEPQVVNLNDLRERFPSPEHGTELINRAEKLGLLRKLDDQTYEELAPRVLTAGQDAMTSLGVDARRALKLVEQLRRHAEGVAKLYLELYLEVVWKPFADAGQPDDQWPAVQTALERLPGIAEQALLGMFDVTMAERVDQTFGREFGRMTQSGKNSSKSHSSRSRSGKSRTESKPDAGGELDGGNLGSGRGSGNGNGSRSSAAGGSDRPADRRSGTKQARS